MESSAAMHADLHSGESESKELRRLFDTNNELTVLWAHFWLTACNGKTAL